jgi:alpha-L-fucosidase
MINHRLYERSDTLGDYNTTEQHFFQSARPWEACITSTFSWWGWHGGDSLWKRPRDIVTNLCSCAEGWGNLLLNVGPKPDGTLPQPFVHLATKVGRWLAVNGEAVYKINPTLIETASVGYCTWKGNNVYLLVTYWPGEELHLCGLKNRVRSAEFLADGRRIRVAREGEHIFLRGLPRKAPDPYCTVIKFRTVGQPRPLPWSEQRYFIRGDLGRFSQWVRQ